MRRPERPALVLSCEHASAAVPAAYRALFAAEAGLLGSHRAYDAGALELARHLARHFGVACQAGRVTRLLIDLNRSLESPALFSCWSRALPAAERERLLEAYWKPGRAAVEAAVERARRGGRSVLHVAVHSFTPVWKGRPRSVDLGWLYDPGRAGEAALARRLMAASHRHLPGLRVRRNRPYRGWTDGLTTSLRRRFPKGYSGLELELGQGLLDRSGRPPAALRHALAAVLEEALAGEA